MARGATALARGEDYPTGARVFRRARFDAALNAAALAAGAEARTARVADVTPGPAGTVVRMSDGRLAHAAFAIGADGALSRVGAAARLLRPARALWGFALRAYAAGEVHAPHILLWAPDGRRPFPATAGSSRPARARSTSASASPCAIAARARRSRDSSCRPSPARCASGAC